MENKINKFREIYINYKGIIHNFSYLSAFQVFNMLLPLITYPYLIRVLSTDVYGVVIFAQAIMIYFSMLINFGFNISATKDIAENKNNIEKLNTVVSSVYILKFALWVISFIILFGLILIIPFFNQHWLLFILTFGITFNDLLFPLWFFQGIEKMKYITVINIFAKIIFTILIFLFVKGQEDYLFVPLFYGIGALIGGLSAVYILLMKEGVRFRIQSFKVLNYYFKESLPLFISAASIQIYVNANKVLVGAFLGMKEVAFYDLGEKILRLIKIPIGMLGQATFPSIAREKNISKINNIMKVGVLLTLFLVVIVFVFSKTIVSILGGINMLEAIPIMRILSLSALMVVFSQFLGTARLIVFGYKSIFTQIIASSGIVFCVGAFVLYIIDYINIRSLAWLAVSIEVWVTAVMIYVNYKKKLLK